jgi:hypothetical protein
MPSSQHLHDGAQAPSRASAGVTKTVILLTIHTPSWYYQPAKNQPMAG